MNRTHSTSRRGRTGLVVVAVVGLVLLSMVVAAPIVLFKYAGSGDTIEVANSGLRYRLLIAGSPLEGMPLIEPRADAEFYYRAQDGLSPETRTLVYESDASASSALAFYRTACDSGAFGANGTVSEADASHLVCTTDTGPAAARVSPDGDGTGIIIEIVEP